MFYGFVIISLAWLWQGWKFRVGYRNFDPWFLRLSALGWLILAMDNFSSGNWRTWVSLVPLIVILFLVYKIRR